MDELNKLLKPVWGPQACILDGWNQITPDEKKMIKFRLDDMFKQGLPFELKHDKLIYIHLFSLLAQLEVIAIQIPLKFESNMSTPKFRQQMRAQLLDEIFHSLVFTKILYLLCEPYASPPHHNNVEKFCAFIREETCPKVALVLLNLVAEGWIEELFKCLKKHNVASNVFNIILEDERRHVSEADLYCEIGMPDMDVIAPKLAHLEELLLSSIFFRQYNMSMSLMNLVGSQGMSDYFQAMNQKHQQQLGKLNLTPGKAWQSSMQRIPEIFSAIQQETADSHQDHVNMTPLRQLLISQWRDPVDPTMVGQFNLDITCLDFFNKKYPPETLTTLMLQTVSQLLVNYPEYQLYLKDNMLYQRQEARVALVVKLPGCGDHMGTIVFQDCHTLTVPALSSKIKQVVAMMTYCYKKREELERDYPALISIHENVLEEMKGLIYQSIRPTPPGVSVSNLGAAGYVQGSSPLLSNEASKITLFEVQRTPVWNKESHSFEARDLLPISVSVDHRVYDGLPIPKIMTSIFQDVFQRMKPFKTRPLNVGVPAMLMKGMVDDLLTENLELGYLLLAILQTMWPDYIQLDTLFKNQKIKTLLSMISIK